MDYQKNHIKYINDNIVDPILSSRFIDLYKILLIFKDYWEKQNDEYYTILTNFKTCLGDIIRASANKTKEKKKCLVIALVARVWLKYIENLNDILIIPSHINNKIYKHSLETANEIWKDLKNMIEISITNIDDDVKFNILENKVLDICKNKLRSFKILV